MSTYLHMCNACVCRYKPDSVCILWDLFRVENTWVSCHSLPQPLACICLESQYKYASHPKMETCTRRDRAPGRHASSSASRYLASAVSGSRYPTGVPKPGSAYRNRTYTGSPGTTTVSWGTNASSAHSVPRGSDAEAGGWHPGAYAGTRPSGGRPVARHTQGNVETSEYNCREYILSRRKTNCKPIPDFSNA